LSMLERSGRQKISLADRGEGSHSQARQYDSCPEDVLEDHIRLDPWYGLKEFSASRNHPTDFGEFVYPASAALRHKMNGGRD